jgi:sugar phosphate isomerase/epimerase
MIRLDCLSTLGCADLELDAAITLARRFGLRQLELRALANRLDLPDYLTERFGSPAGLAAHLRSTGMSIPVLDTSFSLADREARERDDFLAFVPWAEALGTRYLRVFDGFQFAPSDPVAAVDAATATVCWWQKMRARNGWSVDMVVETHDLLCASTEALRFEARLDTPVPILWDTWHTWCKGGEKINATWNALRAYVRHVHIKDGVRESVRQFQYTYRIPGTGEFPLRELADLLTQAAYTGSICLEWERLWHPYLPPVEEALAAVIQSNAMTPCPFDSAQPPSPIAGVSTGRN